MNKFYVTTAIAYTNSKPHIGFALELLQADVLARYYAEKLGKDNSYFLTGTDDHGIKIFETAEEKGVETKKFVDGNVEEFKKLTKKLNISNTNFISTSDKDKHWAGAIELWKRIEKNGDFYKKSYEGLYCVGCEAYLTKRDLVDGKCSIHDKKPEIFKEENYFFKLSKYKDKVRELIKSDKIRIVPEARKNEILNVLDELDDVSFSRPSEKLSWGIPVPSDETQTMYVWCDALSNYISALGFGTKNDSNFKKFWPADVHVIGKDILKFHAIYWPAMLLSAGFSEDQLPKTIFVHGYITSEGKKMSKSLGNVVDPFEVVDKYGLDAVRYYLLKEIPPTGDGDFSIERFEEVYNADLVNNLGNLVNRVISLSVKNKLNHFIFPIKNKPIDKFKFFFPDYFDVKYDKVSFSVESKKISDFVVNFNYNLALDHIFSLISSLNRFIECEKPWKINDFKEFKKILSVSADILYFIANELKPFLPDTSEKIIKQLETLEPEILFPRLEK